MYEERVPMKIALKALMMNKTTYYYEVNSDMDKRRRSLDHELEALLKHLNGYDLVYGYRKVTELFEDFNHKKVYRHMKRLNMLQPRKLKKKKTLRLPIECPIRSNVRWEGDLTYVWDGAQTNYLFAIVDTYDKEPVGDYYGLRCRAEELVVSLEEAVKNRFGNLEIWPLNKEPRVRLRVDQGSQYISGKFKKRARELGIQLDYCGINCPDDKPYIESFFARYKCEEVYRNDYRSYTHAFTGWIAYKQWYKYERIHQGLDYMTIPKFKQQREDLLNQELFWSKNMGA